MPTVKVRNLNNEEVGDLELSEEVFGAPLDQPKTKEFIAALERLGLDGTKTLIVDSLENGNLILSARNVQRAKVVSSQGLNIYDLLYHEKLILSGAAAAELEQLLGPKQD